MKLRFRYFRPLNSWVNTSYLYVIGPPDGAGPNKLGYSENPSKRLSSLNSAIPGVKHILHHVEPVDAEKVRCFEKLLHRDLAFKRLPAGEWFDLSVQDAIGWLGYIVIQYDAVDDLAKKIRLNAI